MLRWLWLICFCCAPLAAGPTPRECFETFVAAVLNTANLAPEARAAELDRCFDFDAWAAEKEAADAAKLTPTEREELRAQWATLLASEEFSAKWKQNKITIVDAPNPENGSATLTISMGEQRGGKFLVKLKHDAKADFWRWYAIVPQDQKAGDNPVDAPRTPAQRLADIEARLAEIDAAEASLADERAALRKLQRELRAQAEEDRAGDNQLGTPRALADALARAMNRADWGAFVLAHAPAVRRDSARSRFDAQCAKVAVWSARQVAVVEPGLRAVLILEVRGADNRSRMVALQCVREGGRWWINEEP